MTEQDHTFDTQISRPKTLVLLSILIFLFSLVQLFRFSQIVFHWKIMAVLSLSIGPGWLSACSLIWSGIGVFLTFSLWTGKRWSIVLGYSSGGIFSIYHWASLIWLVEPSTLQARWPLNLALTIIGLGILITILSLKSTRAYLGKNGVKIT